jgi:hypothetical protein
MNSLAQYRAAVGVSVFTFLAASLWAIYRKQASSGLPDISARIDRILKNTPLIDGHNDLPYLLRIELQNKINGDRFTFRQGAHTKELLKKPTSLHSTDQFGIQDSLATPISGACSKAESEASFGLCSWNARTRII